MRAMTKSNAGQKYCVDLFAGCGGLSLGLELAGFKTLLFSELNDDAADTFQANHKDAERCGNITDLTKNDCSLLLSRLEFWKKAKGVAKVDLVCGGPPCQGYSGIGHRRTFKLNKEQIPSNHLYEEMIKVIKVVKPRVFLFENVKGLLSAKWTAKGENGEIFRQVLKAFRDIDGYEVRWQLVRAKDYGVPQNRPRVLIVGISQDEVMPSAREVKKCEETIIEPTAVVDGWLPECGEMDYPHLRDLLDDLVGGSGRSSDELKDVSYWKPASTDIQKWLRKRPDGTLMEVGHALKEQEYSKHKPHVLKKFLFMQENGGRIHHAHKTKKFAQRLLLAEWPADGPFITATSLPDDYVHYAEPRTLTVREWARLQTFPDWYEFKGPRTTGGRRRAGDPSKDDWSRDVPRYTQIGNAVPVLLAKALGGHFIKLLKNERKAVSGKGSSKPRRHK
jgi:DNA (cytosine-5)-methyltransferase 1